MRILQIHNRYRRPGGEDAVVAAEAALLRDAGHDVHQYLVDNPAQAMPAALRYARAAWNPTAARTVRGIVADADPDVVHVHNTWFSLTSSVLPAIADTPLAMTLHNYRYMCSNGQLLRSGVPCELCIDGSAAHAVRYGCYHDSRVISAVAAGSIALNRRRGTWVDSVDRFFALTEFARERFVRAGLPAAHIAVKPNFAADAGARTVPPSASATVLFVGRVSAEKGLDTVLAAWRRDPPPGLEFLVVGDGPDLARHEAAPPPGVRFAGRLEADEVRREMLRARALVFPSIWYEGQPLTLLEAFSAGLPVLASDLGAMAEMLSPTPEWLVTPGNPAGWSAALHRLAERDVDDAGARLRRSWEERHTPARALAELERHYGMLRNR